MELANKQEIAQTEQSAVAFERRTWGGAWHTIQLRRFNYYIDIYIYMCPPLKYSSFRPELTFVARLEGL